MSSMPSWPDINITPVFSYMWGLLHDIFDWASNSYFVFYGNRINYAQMAIFCMAFGFVLMLSPFGKAANAMDPDIYDTENDEEMTSASNDYDFPDF